jgi:glycosyltransferase involved in cell wall biosynthesis
LLNKHAAEMNILFVHGSHNETGGDTVYLNLLTAQLALHNVWVHLISIEKGDKKFSVNIRKSTSREHLNFGNLREVNEMIRRYCDEFQIDLIHIHTVHWPSVTENCLTLAPVIKTPHATDLICPGSYKFYSQQEKVCDVPFGMHCLLDAYTKRCCSRMPGKLAASYKNVYHEVHDFSRRYKRIVVMSEYVKSECVSAGIDESKISVIPYFTMPVPGQGINSPVRRLLYLGRLSQVKGVHVIIEPLAPLLKENDDVIFDIIGDGPYRKTIEAIVDRMEIRDKVIFHGWKDRDFINDALARSYMLLFPSIYPEAFGISGIEAMMHGKPVVGFDVGGVSTWLTNEVTGFLVPVGDSAKFVEHVQRLLDDGDLKQRMGEKAREIAMKDFSPEQHISKLLDVYKSSISPIKSFRTAAV